MATDLSDAHLDGWRAVLNAHATVIARVEEDLAAAGLPPLRWYDVLWAVRRAPDRRIRLAELADRVTISRGGLTKVVDRLQADGLLRREQADEDGRGLYAVLTDRGNDLLRRMWPVYARALRESFAEAMDEDEAAALASALTRVEGRVDPRAS